MNAQQAQLAITILKAVWSSLSQGERDKIKAWVLAQVKDLSMAEIHAFFASLPQAGPEPSTMDSIEAGHMLGNDTPR